MVAEGCLAKVSDLGCARVKQHRMTMHVGTPEFQAPEMKLLCDNAQDAQSAFVEYTELVDSWAFGHVLSHAMCVPALLGQLYDQTVVGAQLKLPDSRLWLVACPSVVRIRLYELAHACWSTSSERPSFGQLANELSALIDLEECRERSHLIE